MNTSKTLLWLGVLLLVLPAAQCQTGNTTQQVKVKKSADASPGVSQDKPTPTEPAKSDTAKAASAVKLENARVDAMDPDSANISLRECPTDPTKICDGRVFPVKVDDKGLRAQLKQQFHVGDHIRIDIDGTNELQDILGAYSFPPDGISPIRRFLVLAACALALLALAAAVTRGSPLKFIVGMDHRYSNSKFQLALWFWVVMSTYLATVLFRVAYAGWDFFGAVSIPQNLLVLSGLSAITYGGAKAITTAKADAAEHPITAPGEALRAPILDPKGVNTRMDGQERFFKDLVQNDAGSFDFGDFQMLVVTFVAVGMYMTLIFHFLGSIEFLKTATLPDVDSTILAGFGLGQGAYLAKKAGGDVGKS